MKVKLPKKDFDFLDYHRASNDKYWKQKILWDYLHHDLNFESNLDTILAALVNDFEVEVPQEDKVRDYFLEAIKIKELKYPSSESYIKYASKVETVIEVLNLLNIKIEGVNSDEETNNLP